MQAVSERQKQGFIFYFDYRVTAGAKVTQEIIPQDLTEPATLVISEIQRNVYSVTIISQGQKIEWTVDEIVSLKFGFAE